MVYLAHNFPPDYHQPMTHNLTTVLLAAALSFATATATATATASAEDHAKDSRLYELRTYHAEAGKLDALLARFRDHTVKLFEKNGMTNIGYWVPVDNKDIQTAPPVMLPGKNFWRMTIGRKLPPHQKRTAGS